MAEVLIETDLWEHRKKRRNEMTADQWYKQIDLDVVTLDELKEAKVAQLNEACFYAITSGFESDALGEVHSYPSDTEAQNNLGFAIKRLELEPEGTTVDFKTLDAGYLLHTLPQLHEVFKDGFDCMQLFISRYNELKEQVNGATTKDEVDSINW